MRSRLVFVTCVLLLSGSTLLPRASATWAKNQGGSDPVYDFDKLTSLIQRLDVLESSAPETLLAFYEPALRSFSVKPGQTNKKKRVCITSTCYALLTATTLTTGVYDPYISRNDDDDDNDEDDDTTRSSTTSTSKDGSVVVPIRQVLRTLLASQWRQDDLFQVPLLIQTILRVDRPFACSVAEADPAMAARIQTLLSVVLSARPRGGRSQQQHSDYISYQACKVLAMLQDTQTLSSSKSNSTNTNTTKDDNVTDVDVDDDDDDDSSFAGLPKAALPPDMASETFWALLRCAEVSSNELCRQLAYDTAGDWNSFDVIRLAYSLLTYIRSTSSLADVAGREVIPGQGPSPETKVAPLNPRLVAAALAKFFEHQNSNGLWPKGQPIYNSFTRRGRNMGNAFVFSVNTLGSLLCMLPAQDFRPHLSALERTLDWMETHQTLEIISSYCDPVTGQWYGKPLRGWSSPHQSPDAGPQAWPTAQVLKCISWMRQTIRELMHTDVLEEFHGVAYSKYGVVSASWDHLLDTDLGDPSQEGGCRTIKSVLEERVVQPFAASIDNPSYGAAYSAILFGPPGTAKTTICEALAQRMGYDFCVIDTAAFLADGLTNVSARIRYVFSRLMALKKCVILFDEIEEFALDRETPGLSMESRMLTTAMLTAINDLRRNEQSIFFVATNRLKAMDSAITRPGRFDMQLFVGTPNLESRVIQFQQKLSGMMAGGGGGNNDNVVERRRRAIESYRKFLKSVWSKDAMFMNYMEGMQFASACAELVATNHELSTKDMSNILQSQAAVMTVRGAAREDYVASMELSRL